MSENYETSGFSHTLDLGASKRKFQTSVIISQDKTKAGVLSFLSKSVDSAQVGNNSSGEY